MGKAWLQMPSFFCSLAGAGCMSRAQSMHRYRTIWISDVHLGTRGCKAEFLLDFLRRNDADTFYLVGDIIDGWRLKKSWYWPQTHNDVVQKLLRMVRKGTRAIYVPGNHDEWLRDCTRLQFRGVEVVEEAIHLTADGQPVNETLWTPTVEANGPISSVSDISTSLASIRRRCRSSTCRPRRATPRHWTLRNSRIWLTTASTPPWPMAASRSRATAPPVWIFLRSPQARRSRPTMAAAN
jgi:hypothetical protein